MIDSILHLLGLCPDHSVHINFVDYICYFGFYDIQLLINITINTIKAKCRYIFKLMMN